MIRRMRAGDIGTVITLRSLMFEAMGTPTTRLSDIAWQQQAARWLQLHLGDERVRVVVAEVNGAVVSCAMGQVVDLMPSPERRGDVGGLLTNVATFPRHRRLGFSEACVRAVVEWFQDATDVDVITLNATDEGAPTYERLGFVPSTFPEMRLHLDRAVEVQPE